MAWKYLAVSGDIGTSGSNTIATKIIINGTDPGATDPGTVTLRTGGASGTVLMELKVQFGHSDQVDLPLVTMDYVNLVDAKVIIEYYKQHGLA